MLINIETKENKDLELRFYDLQTLKFINIFTIQYSSFERDEEDNSSLKYIFDYKRAFIYVMSRRELKGYSLMKVSKGDNFEVLVDWTIFAMFEDHGSEKLLFIDKDNNEGIFLAELTMDDFLTSSGSRIQYSKVEIPYSKRRILFKTASQAKKGIKKAPLEIKISKPILVLGSSLTKTPTSSPCKKKLNIAVATAEGENFSSTECSIGHIELSAGLKMIKNTIKI